MNATTPTNHTDAPSSIHTDQSSIHADLSKIVARHAQHPFQKPIALHNQLAFDELIDQWAQRGFAPLILDSGCGVGESTLHIAQAHPECFVVGVDQSQVRIQTQKTWWREPTPENLLWLRADVVDVWRLLAACLTERGQTLYKHYILYPNPYPKIGQLHKRWHGHAVFPALLSLGGMLEARSNWDIYIQEFTVATTQLTQKNPEFLGELTNTQAITPFERKYQTRGEHLWGVRFELSTLNQ
ncbi:MAG: putative S-adenosylmethionine-dependent methyltransferase [Burkholderiaceae bacterium]|nr:putative S-adenosylmethionine-dependent methyltransferase [Burkholderiaceae bacterium]